MAELHVQTKKHSTANSMWIWIVVVLIIAAAVIYYLTARNKNANTATPSNTTGFIYTPVQSLATTNALQLTNAAAQAC